MLKDRVLSKVSTVMAALLIPLLIVFFSPFGARGEDLSGANFMVRDPILDNVGGRATSTSFEQLNSGGQLATGVSTSTNFEVRSGFLYFDTFSPKSQNWRWYNDEANETPSLPLGAENVAPSGIDMGDIIKLRITVKESAGLGKSGVKFKLQYSTFSDFSQNVLSVEATSSCSVSLAWCYANGGGEDNGVITTKVLTDSDACSGGSGSGCGTHNENPTSTSTFIQIAGAATEYEFTIINKAASANTTYFFRLYDVTASAAVPLNSGATYPSLTTGGAQFSFTLEGLPAGTSTEGVITDVDASPTAVNFGTLSGGSEIKSGQRFRVSTNASHGYQIFVYQRQGLISSPPTEIEPVSGINESPTSFGSGCPATQNGCFGYHTGDDTLDGGSSRFAPNDTYARFEGVMKEIVSSSVPVTDEITDFIFRIKVTAQQPAGIYTSSIVYIVVPTF
jgi:hypothetical protein